MNYCEACKTHNGKHAISCSLVRATVERDLRAKGEAEALRQKILLMREMGVTEADGIKLGPVPVPPKKEETEEEFKARLQRERQRQHDILFAASGTKPILRAVK